MEFQDYYEILGIPRDASPEAVKKAYRGLALKWHPDRHQGAQRDAAEERFKRIAEAHEVLSDPEKRARYDRFGENWKHGQEFTPPDGSRTMSREEFEQAFGKTGGFSDFFARMFGEQFRHDFQAGEGRQRHARYRYRGADVRAELRLTVGDLIRGGKHGFVLPAIASCPNCAGVGVVAEHVCPTCAGVGQVRTQKEVELTLPANARNGMVLRLAGLGEPGHEGGQPGDLHLTLGIESDATYRVSGNDVETDVEVTPWDAVFGTRLEVRTVVASAVARIPPDTPAGRKLRLRGQGLDDGRGGRGDFTLVVRLALPGALNARQRELLREMQAAGSDPVHLGGAS